MAVDDSGNLYFSSGYWHTIRKMTPDGTVSTIAGKPGTSTPMGSSGDGQGTSATFKVPNGVALDSKGNLFVADGYNCTIRMITPSGSVSTFAGLPQNSGDADGTGAQARFSHPGGILVGPGDIVYVADGGSNSTIRKITPDGTVSTLAGTPGAFGFADGTGPAAQFDGPGGLAMDASHNLYVTDYGNNAIRRITPAGVVTTIIGTPNLSGNILPSGLPGTLSVPFGLSIGTTTPLTQLWILTTGGIVYAQVPAP